MNINGCVPILIYTLDTIVSKGNILTVSDGRGYLLDAAGGYSILLML